MLEIVRRVVLLVAFPVGILLVFWRPTDLRSVEPVDWQAQWLEAQARQRFYGFASDEEGRPREAAPPTEKMLGDFIRDTVQNRVLSVQGPHWEGLLSAVAATLGGQPPDESWAMRTEDAGWSAEPERLFLRVKELAPPDELLDVARLGDYGYLQIVRPEGSQYLRLSGVSYFPPVPPGLVHPYRRHGIFLMLAALVLYAVLPWPKPPAVGLWYSRIRAGFLPDLLATMFLAMLATFWAMAIVACVASGDTELGIFVTAVICLFLTFPLLLYGIGAWYMSKHVAIDGERFVCRSLRCRGHHRLDEIARIEVTPVVRRWVQWVRRISAVGMLVNPRLAPAHVASSSREDRFRITLRDGQTLDFTAQALLGLAAFVHMLQQRSVTIDASVEPFLAAGHRGVDAQTRFRTDTTAKWRNAVVAVGVVVLALWAWCVEPPMPIKIEPAAGTAATATLQPIAPATNQET